MKDWRVSGTTATVSVPSTWNMQRMMMSWSSCGKRQRNLKQTWNWPKSSFEMEMAPTLMVLETT